MGGDDALKMEYVTTKTFQFPPPRGGRLLFAQAEDMADTISIPAPAWGATNRFRALNLIVYNFNSRPRVGGDVIRPPSIPWPD